MTGNISTSRMEVSSPNHKMHGDKTVVLKDGVTQS